MTAFRPMGLANAAHAARRAAEVKAERRLRSRLRWHLRHPKRRLLAAYLAGAEWTYCTYASACGSGWRSAL